MVRLSSSNEYFENELFCLLEDRKCPQGQGKYCYFEAENGGWV